MMNNPNIPNIPAGVKKIAKEGEASIDEIWP